MNFKIKTIYKIFPVLVVYTNKFLKEPFVGVSWGPIIFIRPEMRNNEIVLEHELVHSKQFFRTFGLQALLYKISDKKKLYYELEAYATYIKRNPNIYGIKNITNRLSSNYNLKYTYAEIYKYASEYYKPYLKNRK